MNICKYGRIFTILYMGIICYFTLFTREIGSVRVVKGLFWEIKNSMWFDIGLNILLFVPLGFFLSFIIDDLKSIFYGCILSICIELTQYLFALGFCEVDDVLNNTIGMSIGFFICLLYKKRKLE